MSNWEWYKYKWIWVKNSPTCFVHAKNCPMHNDGELVLDATIGSGSTAVAAVNTGRHFIGFETEKKFCDIAE